MRQREGTRELDHTIIRNHEIRAPRSSTGKTIAIRDDKPVVSLSVIFIEFGKFFSYSVAYSVLIYGI